MKLMNLFGAVISVISFGSLFGQQSRVETRASGQVKVIEFGKNIEIHQMETTGKYVALRVGPKDRMGHVIYVYDRNGNALFQKAIDSTEDIEQVELSDSLGRVLRIDLSFGPHEGCNRHATAYDIKTGGTIWRAPLPYHEGADYNYRVSPDGIHMLNSGEGAPAPVLNLTDGSRLNLNIMQDVVGADWLDNERIVLAVQQSKPNPEVVPSAIESNATKAKADSLRYAVERTLIEHEKGMISLLECQSDTARMIHQIDSLMLRWSNNRRSHIPSRLPAAARLLIFNIRTSQIELQKDIYCPDGEPVTVFAGLGGQVGIINVEPTTGSIFFYGEKGDKRKDIRCLIKLNRGLDVLMCAPFQLAPLFRLNVAGEIRFATHMHNAIFLLDNNTGKFATSQTLTTEAGTFQLDLDPVWLSTRTFARGIATRNRAGILEFSIKKEGQQ